MVEEVTAVTVLGSLCSDGQDRELGAGRRRGGDVRRCREGDGSGTGSGKGGKQEGGEGEEKYGWSDHLDYGKIVELIVVLSGRLGLEE